MLNKMRNRQGFTLIELLIVVAIIGILAAVAILQFAAYRIKGFNSASSSDLKNAKTTQEALFADNQTYGWSESPVKLGDALGSGGAPAAVVRGAVSGATATAEGLAIAGLRADPNIAAGVPVAIGAGISNNVDFYATNIAGVASPAYIMAAKHAQGNRVFAAESGSTAIMYVQAAAWAGVPLEVGGAPATGVPATAATDPTLLTTVNGGGDAPGTNWASL